MTSRMQSIGRAKSLHAASAMERRGVRSELDKLSCELKN